MHWVIGSWMLEGDNGISLVVKSEQLTTDMSNPHNKWEKKYGNFFYQQYA